MDIDEKQNTTFSIDITVTILVSYAIATIVFRKHNARALVAIVPSTYRGNVLNGKANVAEFNDGNRHSCYIKNTPSRPVIDQEVSCRPPLLTLPLYVA